MIDIMDLVYKLLLFIDKNMVIVIGGLLVYYLIISLSIYSIYKKVGIKETKALIPVYNILSILDFVSLPKFLVILFVVPYVNFLGIIIGGFVVNSRIGRVLQKGSVYRMLLGILPIVFLPLLATSKNLTYEKIEQYEEPDEEEKDDTLDIPTYKVEVKEVDNLAALSVDELFNSSSPINNKPVVDEFSSEEKGVEDLTFDYNQLYSNDSKDDSSVIEETKDDISNGDNMEEFKFDIDTNSEGENVATEIPVVETPVEVQPEPVIEQPIPVETVEPELPVVEAPVEVQPEPVIEQPIPVETVEPELPVVEAPIEVQPEQTTTSVSSDYTFDYNALYGSDTPVVEEPAIVENKVETPVEPVVEETVNEENTTVETEVPVVDTPVEVQPEVVEQPVLEDVVVDAVEDIYANVPAPAEPVVEETVNEENTTVETEVPVVDTPVEVQPEVVEQPVLEDVVVDAVEDIYANVPAPAEPVPEVKILKDDDTDELLKQSKDGMTLDYNSLYNIEVDTTYEEEQKKKAAEEELQKEAEEKGMLAIDPYSAINVAEAPSFDFDSEPAVEEIEEPVVEEIEEPAIEENLVSMDIEEPGLLPVGKITDTSAIRLDKKKKEKYDDVVEEPVKGPNSMGLADLMSTPGSKKNPGPAVPTNNQEMPQNVRPMNAPQGGRAPMNGPVRGNPNMRPAPGPQRGNPGPRPNGPRPMNGPNGPVLRPQGGQNYGPRPNNSKFISNDKENYSLPKEEPAYVQQPTDPNLRANPMSIFGSGASAGLRPTSDEAIRQRRRPQNNNQNNNGLCPFCGFAVKPGQPRCVMCGRRLI